VYDVTPLSAQYPLGEETLFGMCGTDVTDTFLAQDLPGTFYAQLSEHRQGDLEI
jgi:hypothetical protein